MATVQVGERLGRYDLTAELGQGGMSVVYRARDTQLKREVAVKVMHGFLAEQPESRERFRREAVAVANLRHPNIIEIYDYADEDADAVYMVAELVDGMSLAALLQGQAVVPPEAALLIARPIADALRCAHEAGVVHRDVKPENVLIGRDGSLKLTDFGIARMLDNQTLTVTGTLLGSPAYMAPEYIDGQEPDERSDIFSFGATLYQLLCGTLPFTGPTPHALLKRIASGDFTPINQQNPAVHAAIARITHRCLEKEPSLRYAAVAHLLEDMEAFLERVGIDAEHEIGPLLCDLGGYGETIAERLPHRYVELGRAALREKDTGAAIEDFDRVLSLDPDNHEVRAALDRLARRALFGNVAKNGIVAVLGAAVVTALGVWLWPMVRTSIAPAATPAAEVPTQVAGAPSAASFDERKNVRAVLRGPGDLYVDGEVYWDEGFSGEGLSGDYQILLEPGEHHLAYRSGDRVDETSIFVPATGRTPLVELDVAPPGAPRPPRPPGAGAASSTASPARPGPAATEAAPVKTRRVEFNAAQWVNVFLDGSDTALATGKSRLFTLELPYGQHTLRFTNDFAKARELALVIGETSPPGRVTIDLEPKDAYLKIDGAPPGGALTVEVAGKEVRLAEVNINEPILVPLQEGLQDHKVRITKDGYAPLEQTVRFKAGTTTRLSVALRPSAP